MRTLRTDFPKVEAMLLNGEEVAITKHGQVVALLVQPAKRRLNRKLDFKTRFGASIKSGGRKTDVVGMLLEEREESF